MAEGFNPINYVGFQDPSAALRLQQQQALAAQLMAEGEPRKDINQVASQGPYGQVIPYSPLEGLSKALEKGLGGYMQGRANAQLADAIQGPKVQSAAQSPNGQAGAPLLPWQDPNQAVRLGSMLQGGSDPSAMNATEMREEAFMPGMGKAAYEARLKDQYAGSTKAAETANTPFVTPQGTYQMGSSIMGGKVAPTSMGASYAPTAASQAFPGQKGGNVPLTDNNAPASTASKSAPAIVASDGKPLLPDINTIPKPDPTGTPRFKTENTKTGVEQTLQDQKDAAEGNKAFATTAQSLSQEKARIDNLIQIYKDVQSGTLTAQNPELFNKLAALGFRDDPKSIHDLAGVQNATMNHILQVIQQIKDTNASAGGGAPTRTFGAEISQLLENGESAKDQPEALWNIIGQAKGLVDHHLDMINGWNQVGGLGNRLAGGYTMRPDDYAQKFTINHDISDYRDKALKDMGPFKGMPGNNGNAPAVDAQAIVDELRRRGHQIK